MKSGRAERWAVRVFQWEESHEGYPKFLDCDEFQKEFWNNFCLAHSNVVAINKLELVSYYQKARSVDDYLDEFIEPVTEVDNSDPKMVMIKFQKGLDLWIQNTIATMAHGCPSDIIPEEWYEAARRIDQNCSANEAFQAAYRVPTLSSCLVPVNPLQTIPVTIHTNLEKDTHRRRNTVLLTCYKCGKLRHKTPDFPLIFNIRSLTTEEIEMELMAQKDLAEAEKAALKVEESVDLIEDFVQDNE